MANAEDQILAPASIPLRVGAWIEHDQPVCRTSGRPRILLLTQAFPPRTEIGATRWEGFAPFLADAGWGIDVVIENPKDLTNPDWTRFARLPNDVRVAAAERKRPRFIELLTGFRRATQLASGKPPVPRASSLVEHRNLRTVVREALTVIVQGQQSRQLLSDFTIVGDSIVDARHQLIISSGPSHYVHIAAANIARKHHLPFVVDLRDPWMRETTANLAERILPDHELVSHEAATLTSASLIITNTVAAEQTLGRRYPALRSRICAIPNGSDFAPVFAKEISQEIFQIAHCGSLYLDRDPRPFLTAVARVRSQLSLTAQQLRVVFMGPPVQIHGQTLTQIAEELGIGDMFEERPQDTRTAARQLLMQSSMAVAFQGQTPTQVPAKVFEYVSLPLWLLALVGTDSATAHVLRDSEAIVLDIDDVDSISAAIQERYLNFRAGAIPRPVGHDGRFSRELQAKSLIAKLRGLVANVVEAPRQH